MNPTHIHILITHLPVFGGFLGLLVLLYGFYQKSESTKQAAYLIFIVSSIGAGIAYLTGEPAEESVEHLQGVVHDMIEEHEDAAQFALITNIIAGLASLAALWTSFKNLSFASLISKLVLIFALFGFTSAARTAFLGGKIRHSEIHGNVSNQGSQDPAENQDDD